MADLSASFKFEAPVQTLSFRGAAAPIQTPLREGFPNLLSEFIYVRTYSRWLPEKGRRETWEETVSRYIEFLAEERQIPATVLNECRAAILRMEVMPSMRALWSAGEAARRDNTCMYNCAFAPIDSLRSFSEMLYILMCGTGVGFSVERRFTSNLPPVATPTGETVSHVIEDSTEGWSDALYFGLQQWFQGNRVEFDYSNIRPAGSPLAIKGGRASGPEPLERLMRFTEESVLAAAGRQLRPIECHDIVCHIAEIVMVGGFRRAALISFSDQDDAEMRHAKDWSRGKFPEIRYMANNSAVWDAPPERSTFRQEWAALRASGSGERGLFRFPPSKRASRRGDCRTNPCGEIMLRYLNSEDAVTGAGGGGQFCNLTAAVMRADDTRETFAEKVRLATWLGAIQASFTHFPYLRYGWEKTCNEDRLLGVDITGQCDNPGLSQDPEAMRYFNKVARETAAMAAATLDIAMPAAVTCGKPSGNTSQLVDCASGFHPRYAPYYFRHVRISGQDPLFALARDAGLEVFKENGQEHLPDEEVTVWVVRFPVKSPDGAILRDHESAIEMCNRYLHVMQTWCGERGHNQSVTIYVRDDEWDEVEEWVYNHFDEITGISFLPYDGGNYRLPPYMEITRADYEAAVENLPEVDFSLLSMYEHEDRGGGAQTLACTGGACEIDLSPEAIEAGKAPA